MSRTGAQIEEDVLEIINRTEASSVTLVDLAVRSAHLELQGLRDWNAQRITYRRLSDVNYRFTYPSGFKTPSLLFRVTGTDLTSDLVPALPSTTPISEKAFWTRTSFEQVLLNRANLQARILGSASQITNETHESYAINGSYIELGTKVNDASNQFALVYYGILDYPNDSNDWFTDMCFAWLTMKACIWMWAALGEVDPRSTTFEKLLPLEFNKCIGFDVALDLGGDSLVMAG